MRLKYADYPEWKRVKKKKYINEYFRNDEFEGNISLLVAEEIKEKLVITKHDKELVILDNNFKWLEIYPENNKHICVSVAIDDKDEILEWYFDIAKDSLLTDKGVPYIIDLYLDITLSPLGKIEMLDEDELKEALDNNEITKEDYDLAYRVANELIEQIDGKVEQIKSFSYKYYELLEYNI